MSVTSRPTSAIATPLCWAAGVAALAATLLIAAQQPGSGKAAAASSSSPDPPVPSPSADGSEMTTHDAEPMFKLQVERNLVVVRAVVRNSKGQALGNLHQEDFRLFDNGKPQTITHFSVESPAAGLQGLVTTAQKELEAETQPETALARSTPDRYMALYFDDVHGKFGDLVRTRDAAAGYLAKALRPGDRVGVFTSSGRSTLDFTNDRSQLHEALFRLQPRPVAPTEENACPEIVDYQAYLIVETRDSFATDIAVQEAYHCTCGGLPAAEQAQCLTQVQSQAEALATHRLNAFQIESEYALRGLDQLVGRISALPGQRSIVLVSPGFLTLTREARVSQIVDRALRSSVVVNTLDAKGLYAPIPYGDASKRPVIIPDRPDLMGRKSQMIQDSTERAEDVLGELAADTGGVFFHNSNDLDDGFRKVGALPDVYYVLGFSPQNLKTDGRFHSLKVKLLNMGYLSVQARQGYYAPKKSEDASTRAKEEIEEALFSRDELNEIPIDVHTQFFRVSDTDSKLSVVTRVDVNFVHFRKEGDRNRDDLTVITALFDGNGNYVTGKQKSLEMRLRDVSLTKLSHSGINMKTTFDVKPGTYMVRQVVRDDEGGRISGLTRTVEIPF